MTASEFPCAICSRGFANPKGRSVHERAHGDLYTEELRLARDQEARQRYAAAHPDELRARAKERWQRHGKENGAKWHEWYLRNKERRAEYDRKRRIEKADQIKLQAAGYRAQNRERMRAADKERRRSGEYLAKQRERQARDRIAGKTKARAAVNDAIRAGRITSLPCEECGTRPTQAHHARGYSREHWLDVVWLCRDHHVEAHKPGTLALREQASEAA